MTNTIPATVAIGTRSKPNHTARAVDTVFGTAPTGDSKRRLAAAEAGAKSVSAEPMSPAEREGHYRRQRPWLTARQGRRLSKKFRATLGPVA